MKCKRAESLLQEIDIAIANIRGFTIISPLEESYLAKFLIVYICGIYEESIESIINERIFELRSRRLTQFFEDIIRESFRNPSVANVSGLLGKFDDKWKNEIRSLPPRAKDSFNSISNNKNRIAHGDPINVTLSEVIEYYLRSRQVIEKIDAIVRFK